PPTMNCVLVIVMRTEPVAAQAFAGIQASIVASDSAATADFIARPEANIVGATNGTLARPVWHEDAGIRRQLSTPISLVDRVSCFRLRRCSQLRDAVRRVSVEPAERCARPCLFLE